VVSALDLQLTVMSLIACNMAIFRFLKMAAAAIVDFENFTFSTVGTVEATYVILPNFIEIARTATDISQFFDFSKNSGRRYLFLNFFFNF